MSRLPIINSKKLVKVLQKLGFNFKRQHGSHAFFEHRDKRTTIIPMHFGEDIDRGLLIKIIKQDLQITREDFVKLL